MSSIEKYDTWAFITLYTKGFRHVDYLPPF